MGAEAPALGSQRALAQPRFRKAYGREERPASLLLLLPWGHPCQDTRCLSQRPRNASRRPSARDGTLAPTLQSQSCLQRWAAAEERSKPRDVSLPSLLFLRTRACVLTHTQTHRSTWMLRGAGAVAAGESRAGSRQAGELPGSAAVKWD